MGNSVITGVVVIERSGTPVSAGLRRGSLPLDPYPRAAAAAPLYRPPNPDPIRSHRQALFSIGDNSTPYSAFQPPRVILSSFIPAEAPFDADRPANALALTR